MTDAEIIQSARGMVLSWLAEWATMMRVDQTPDQRGLDAHARIVDRHIDALLDIRRDLAKSWGWLPPPAPFPFQERTDSVDEHGNRLDTCGVCPHGYWPSTQPVEVADRIAVLSWDWREQPDLAQLARVVRDISGGTVHVREVDTGSDQFAIVIAGTDLDEADTQAVYERWLHGGPPDTEEVNRGR